MSKVKGMIGYGDGISTGWGDGISEEDWGFGVDEGVTGNVFVNGGSYSIGGGTKSHSR